MAAVSGLEGVSGTVAPGFEPVAVAFARNFAEHGELGAAFAVARGDELLVDLWGGLADRTSRRPWAQDTLQVIFSGTKGVVAVCILLLVERGLLDLEAPVERTWPGFGKPAVRVRDVMAHTARLPGIDEPVGLEDVLDPRGMAERLARQAQSGDPRAALCYHALTYGWLAGELVRRVDGRSLGRFVAEEVAGPLGLELWIGLPEELEPRVATLELAPGYPSRTHRDWQAVEADPLLRSIWANPVLLMAESFPWNERRFHAAEIAAANGIASARSLARLYASLDRLLAPETLQLATTTLSEGRDEANEGDARFGVGFALQTADRPFGPVDEAFGHGGAGGSLHGAWPRHRIGFSYAMNLMCDGADPDPRPQALLDALASVL